MHDNLPTDRLLVLDFGSQYSQLITRRLRDLGVYTGLMPFDAPEATIAAFQPKGVVLSGSPSSTQDLGAPTIPDVVASLNVPVLGICYGMQAMVQAAGGTVVTCDQGEFGGAELTLTQPSWLTEALGAKPGDHVDVWMSHCEQVAEAPSTYTVVASTPTCPIAAVAHQTQPYLGVQFHPEVTHSEGGLALLKHFALHLCGCTPTWTTDRMIATEVERLRDTVGSDRVILGLSGGVDSAVAAALLHNALGDQLTCVLVDTGLLRLNEADQVLQAFEPLGLSIVRVNAQAKFFDALMGLDDPEQKRKTIGRVFVDVFEEQARSMDGVRWLAQGTIYPDVIESAGAASGKADVIKSHHNVGGLPERLDLQLIEPLRSLFKDEVRQLGLALGLPASLIHRHPFPGPGLGVRILGEVTPDNAELCRQADALFLETLAKHGMMDQVSQAFAVFLPIKSVGVVGDARRYAHVVALRAVTTDDFMTARWAPLSQACLSEASSRIINTLPDVARVVYDVSDKPPATIEWE